MNHNTVQQDAAKVCRGCKNSYTRVGKHQKRCELYKQLVMQEAAAKGEAARVAADAAAAVAAQLAQAMEAPGEDEHASVPASVEGSPGSDTGNGSADTPAKPQWPLGSFCNPEEVKFWCEPMPGEDLKPWDPNASPAVQSSTRCICGSKTPGHVCRKFKRKGRSSVRKADHDKGKIHYTVPQYMCAESGRIVSGYDSFAEEKYLDCAIPSLHLFKIRGTYYSWPAIAALLKATLSGDTLSDMALEITRSKAWAMPQDILRSAGYQGIEKERHILGNVICTFLQACAIPDPLADHREFVEQQARSVAMDFVYNLVPSISVKHSDVFVALRSFLQLRATNTSEC